MPSGPLASDRPKREMEDGVDAERDAEARSNERLRGLLRRAARTEIAGGKNGGDDEADRGQQIGIGDHDSDGSPISSRRTSGGQWGSASGSRTMTRLASGQHACR